MELITIVVGGFVLVVIFAAAIRILGPDLGQKSILLVIAFSIVLKTMFGW